MKNSLQEFNSRVEQVEKRIEHLTIKIINSYKTERKIYEEKWTNPKSLLGHHQVDQHKHSGVLRRKKQRKEHRDYLKKIAKNFANLGKICIYKSKKLDKFKAGEIQGHPLQDTLNKL